MKKIRYLFEAIIVKILFLIFGIMSIDKASNVAGAIARNIGPRIGISNVARNNIKYVMPELNQEQIEEIITEMWDNLGRVFGEFPHIYNLSREEFSRRVEIEGIEHLISVKETQKGGIIFSAHIANWEVSPRIPIENAMDLALIYRHANNPYVDKMISDQRSHHNIMILSKGKKMAKEVIATLNKGKILAMLVDQKMNDGINVPFFGKDAMTASAIAKLALKFNCPVIPFQVIRKDGGAYFKVKIWPPISLDKDDQTAKSVYEIMCEINQNMENWIREYPASWFWLHKRWKKNQRSK